jgi:membrane protein implicated in regulation of membrane protease activity
MDDPQDWQWVWVIATAVFAVGEMTTPGSFFLAPFAVGALAAAVLSFAEVSVTIQWIVFIVVSIATLLALRPLAQRLDRAAVDDGVGSRRLSGTRATVLKAIPGGDDVGMVRVDREEWRAQSTDGTPIPTGATVRVAEVQGTRLLVVVEAVPPVDGPPPGTAPAGASSASPPTEVASPELPPAEPPGSGTTPPGAAAPGATSPDTDSP